LHHHDDSYHLFRQLSVFDNTNEIDKTSSPENYANFAIDLPEKELPNPLNNFINSSDV